MKPYVGYYRVSTAGQGRSSLGLEAQQYAVAQFVRGVGGTLLADFQEVESGGKTERAALKDALRYCKTQKAILVIAKLDRLARNLHFITQLLESGVEFVAADMPTANKLTIHIIAAMAEHERDMISQRTKAALQSARVRGVRLGNPLAAAQSARAAAKNVALADAFSESILPTINALKSQGISSYSGIAVGLNGMQIKTQRGRSWTAAGIRNVVLREAKRAQKRG